MKPTKTLEFLWKYTECKWATCLLRGWFCLRAKQSRKSVGPEYFGTRCIALTKTCQWPLPWRVILTILLFPSRNTETHQIYVLNVKRDKENMLLLKVIYTKKGLQCVVRLGKWFKLLHYKRKGASRNITFPFSVWIRSIFAIYIWFI